MLAGDRVRAQDNLCAALSLFPRWSPGAVSLQRDGVLLVASAAPVTSAFHAGAIRVARGPDARQVVDFAVRFAADRPRDVTVWAASDTDGDLIDELTGCGAVEQPALVGMACPAVTFLRDAARGGVDVRRVTTADDVGDFAEVHRRSVTSAGRDPAAVDHYATVGALTAPYVDAFVARAGGRPVAAAMSLTTGGVAGIYWVVAHPEHRRRGWGRTVTIAVADAAVRRGSDLLVLQATDLGAPLYRELGFTPFTSYRRWLIAPATLDPRRIHSG